MRFYEQEVVEKARVERRKGISLKSLGKRFGIPNTTISRWVRDVPL